mmetsp:Transcript_21703/g.49066  ORF Transcript_21703/g.49066 Transcript_21703/m.49066 type:complete len:346 (+) Transcript_21703:189-1226(+)
MAGAACFGAYFRAHFRARFGVRFGVCLDEPGLGPPREELPGGVGVQRFVESVGLLGPADDPAAPVPGLARQRRLLPVLLDEQVAARRGLAREAGEERDPQVEVLHRQGQVHPGGQVLERQRKELRGGAGLGLQRLREGPRQHARLPVVHPVGVPRRRQKGDERRQVRAVPKIVRKLEEVRLGKVATRVPERGLDRLQLKSQVAAPVGGVEHTAPTAPPSFRVVIPLAPRNVALGALVPKLAESSRNGLTNQGDKERPLPDLQKRSRHGVNRELGEGIKVAVAVDQAGSIAPLHDSLDALFARRRGHANPTGFYASRASEPHVLPGLEHMVQRLGPRLLDAQVDKG